MGARKGERWEREGSCAPTKQKSGCTTVVNNLVQSDAVMQQRACCIFLIHTGDLTCLRPYRHSKYVSSLC